MLNFPHHAGNRSRSIDRGHINDWNRISISSFDIPDFLAIKETAKKLTVQYLYIIDLSHTWGNRNVLAIHIIQED